MNEPRETSFPEVVTDSDNYYSQSTSRWAIACLVIGVFSIFLSLIGILLSCIFGAIAIFTIKASDGRKRGIGLAIAGMVLSVILGLGSLAALLFIRAQARETITQNNSRQLVFSMVNYESTFRYFPSDIQDKTTGEPLLSWRVAILPYIEQQELYSRFRLDEPWDSPANLEAAKFMPSEFQRPGGGAKPGHTSFQRPIGNGAAFNIPEGKRLIKTSFNSFSDGSSNTVVLVETSPEAAVFWSKPEDYNFDPNDPKRDLGAGWSGDIILSLADGSTISINKKLVTKEQLKALFTIAGGDRFDIRELGSR